MVSLSYIAPHSQGIQCCETVEETLWKGGHPVLGKGPAQYMERTIVRMEILRTQVDGHAVKKKG